MNPIDLVLEQNAPEDVLDMLLSALDGQSEAQEGTEVEEGAFVADTASRALGQALGQTGANVASYYLAKHGITSAMEKRAKEKEEKKKKFWDKFKRKPKDEMPTA